MRTYEWAYQPEVKDLFSALGYIIYLNQTADSYRYSLYREGVLVYVCLLPVEKVAVARARVMWYALANAGLPRWR